MKLAQIIWENCRRLDGSIDLQKAARHSGCKITDSMDMYLALVEELNPIKSRQVAALAIANALAIYAGDD